MQFTNKFAAYCATLVLGLSHFYMVACTRSAKPESEHLPQPGSITQNPISAGSEETPPSRMMLLGRLDCSGKIKYPNWDKDLVVNTTIAYLTESGTDVEKFSYKFILGNIYLLQSEAGLGNFPQPCRSKDASKFRITLKYSADTTEPDNDFSNAIESSCDDLRKIMSERTKGLPEYLPFKVTFACPSSDTQTRLDVTGVEWDIPAGIPPGEQPKAE